jgi:hypothetical protein
MPMTYLASDSRGSLSGGELMSGGDVTCTNRLGK